LGHHRVGSSVTVEVCGKQNPSRRRTYVWVQGKRDRVLDHSAVGLSKEKNTGIPGGKVQQSVAVEISCRVAFAVQQCVIRARGGELGHRNRGDGSARGQVKQVNPGRSLERGGT